MKILKERSEKVRKIILPLVLVLALVASVGAFSGYVAEVSMDADPTVSSTTEAELAVARNSSPDVVSSDVIEYTGTPAVVEAKFKKVQRNSEYNYYWVLKITNKKPYDVCLDVMSVTDSLNDTHDFDFRIWATPTETQDRLCQLWGNGAPVSSYCLADDSSCYISFIIDTGDNPSYTNYHGTITFRGRGDTNFNCPDGTCNPDGCPTLL